jgi:16S rRNA (adenine1518-N6/adenine1519-N6)-dimethyltransferase
MPMPYDSFRWISGMSKRRRILGQHFLNSPRFAARIAEIAETRDEVVIEIGAGKGILTKQLARKARRVIAVEIDARLADHLESMQLPNVEVINRDFLQVELNDLGNPMVVGNIPYNITSAIIRKLIQDKCYVKRATLTVQREYAAKIMAPMGRPAYGYLSICVNHYFAVSKKLVIPARYFSPRPSVSSVVVLLNPKKGGIDKDYETRLFEFIAGVFRYRRKSLRNAIMSYLGHLPYGIPEDMLRKRPQHLSLGDYQSIYAVISGT